MIKTCELHFDIGTVCERPKEIISTDGIYCFLYISEIFPRKAMKKRYLRKGETQYDVLHYISIDLSVIEIKYNIKFDDLSVSFDKLIIDDREKEIRFGYVKKGEV